MLIGPSSHHCSPIGRAPLHSSVKRVPGACTGEETAVQAVVGSIVWAFRRLKKPRCREISARGYALHSVCTQLSFFPFVSVAGEGCRLMEKEGRLWMTCYSSRIQTSHIHVDTHSEPAVIRYILLTQIIFPRSL